MDLKTDQPFYSQNNETESEKSHSVAELTSVMKEAGFAPTIINCYKKGLHGAEKGGYGTEKTDVLYNQYNDILLKMKFMLQYDAGDLRAEGAYKSVAEEADALIFDEERLTTYIGQMKNDFSQIRVAALEILEGVEEGGKRVEASQDEVDLAVLRGFLKDSRTESESLELCADARFGYWMTDTICDVFVTAPNLRQEIRDFVYKNRKRILSDHAPVKIKAAEQFLEIIDQLEGIENNDIYKDNFISRTNQIIYLYSKADDSLGHIKDYQCPQIKKPTVADQPKPVAEPEEGVLEVQNTRPEPVGPQTSYSTPEPAVDKPVDRAPSKDEVRQQVEAAKRQWEEQQRIAEQGAAERAEAERKKAEAEAAELAELELQIAELEKAEEEQRQRIHDEEHQVEEDILKKLYKKGERVDFKDITGNSGLTVHETDTEIEKRQKLAKIVQAKRRFDMREAAELHGAEEMVVLKPNDETKAEIYMVVLESETGDSADNIVMLDGDRIGTAAYVGLYRDILKAIELADVRHKKTGRTAEDVSEEDILYFVMKNCRAELQEVGIKQIIHRRDSDIALKFDQAIERLRPPTGELVIPKDI
jgi:hypothetical protein